MVNHEKSLGQIVSELKLEASDFVDTRIQMLRSEVKTKLAVIKVSAPMLISAAVLLFFGFTCLTAALVAVIAIAFGGSIGAWALSAFIVGVAYCIFAAGAGYFGYQQFSAEGLAPKRTMKVLKQDQVWLANEARSQL